MDLNGVETINVATLGGADTITVNDLTGTDTNQVNIDLAESTVRPMAPGTRSCSMRLKAMTRSRSPPTTAW